MWFMLFVFTPIGIYLMWRYKHDRVTYQIIYSVVFSVIFISVVMSLNDDRVTQSRSLQSSQESVDGVSEHENASEQADRQQLVNDPPDIKSIATATESTVNDPMGSSESASKNQRSTNADTEQLADTEAAEIKPRVTATQSTVNDQVVSSEDTNRLQLSLELNGSENIARTPTIEANSLTPLQVNRSSFQVLLSQVSVASEFSSAAYDRDLFRHWIDEDRDGCDTRREVLISESATPVRIGASCTITGGTWYSPYDGIWTTDPSDFDIDHLVPLAEAWRSGAYAWGASTRQAFANDLSNEYSLIAVSASSNRTKSDGDPDAWMPTNQEYLCEYAYMWISVKKQWSLTLDQAEMDTLLEVAMKCAIESLDFSRPALTALVTPTPTPIPTRSCGPDQVDVNSASLNDLERIQHISKIRGQELITLRPYQRVDDLIRINGIGASRLADILAEEIACVNE